MGVRIALNLFFVFSTFLVSVTYFTVISNFIDLSIQTANAQDTSNYLTYQNESLGINMQYPSDWQYFSSEQNDGTLINFAPKFNGSGVVTVSVQPLDLIGRHSLDGYTDYVVGQVGEFFQGIYGLDRVKITGPARMIFSGIPSERTEFNVLGSEEQQFAFVYITTITNNNGYFIAFSPTSEYHQKIVNSISFTINTTIPQKVNNSNTMINDKFSDNTTVDDISKLISLAIASQVNGEHKDALSYFERVLAIDTNNTNALTGKGFNLGILGKNREAMDMFDKVLTINHDHFGAMYGKGEALFNMGRDTEAIIWFDKALTNNSDYVPALAGKGEVLLKNRNFSEAIELFDKVLTAEPSNIYTLNGKGLALFGLGKYDEAIQIYDKVLSIDPDNAVALSIKSHVIEAKSIK